MTAHMKSQRWQTRSPAVLSLHGISAFVACSSPVCYAVDAFDRCVFVFSYSLAGALTSLISAPFFQPFSPLVLCVIIVLLSVGHAEALSPALAFYHGLTHTHTMPIISKPKQNDENNDARWRRAERNKNILLRYYYQYYYYPCWELARPWVHFSLCPTKGPTITHNGALLIHIDHLFLFFSDSPLMSLSPSVYRSTGEKMRLYAPE